MGRGYGPGGAPARNNGQRGAEIKKRGTRARTPPPTLPPTPPPPQTDRFNEKYLVNLQFATRIIHLYFGRAALSFAPFIGNTFVAYRPYNRPAIRLNLNQALPSSVLMGATRF